MHDQTVHIVSQAIRYMEDHLHDKLDLETVAAALHYSKYHLHRIFTKTTGLTIHAYAGRRRLTEAAKLLIFSEKPIMEIALLSGYESQQSFTDTFKSMYKTTPAKFRQTKEFYPLQLEIHLTGGAGTVELTKDDIQFASPADTDDWMKLVTLTIDGYPKLDETEYLEKLQRYITDKKALILRDNDIIIGAMGFSATGSIDFLAVHPQYRHLGIAGLFLERLSVELPPGIEISCTTYRAGDRADTGCREEYFRLGFSERELLVEYGYPVQRFVLSPKHSRKETDDD